MQKKVQFFSGPGLKITGIIEMPNNHDVKGKFPGIVLCHGPGAVKEHLMPDVSKRLVKAGYGVLRFDYRGFGESEGPERRLIPMEQCEDIRNAITFMEQQPEVDLNHIGLWGTATGGANVTYTTGIDARVKCMVSVNSAGDLGRWLRGGKRYWEWVALLKMLEEDQKQRVLTGMSRMVETHEIFSGDPAAKEFFQKVREKHPELKARKRELTLESAEAMISFKPESVVDTISPRAAMWICTSEDTIVPIEESRGMYEKAREPKRLVIIEGFKHHDLYLDSGFEYMMEVTIEWFNIHLKGTTPQQSV